MLGLLLLQSEPHYRHFVIFHYFQSAGHISACIFLYLTKQSYMKYFYEVSTETVRQKLCLQSTK